MTRFLASVRNVQEALLACAEGADWIDLKAPDRGSLGALTPAEITSIVAALGGRKPISATVGDRPMAPEVLTRTVAATFQAGADYVKVGLSPNGQEDDTLQALQTFTRQGLRMVAVLFADQAPVSGWPARLSQAGFAGCMLDTLDKSRASLTQICALSDLRAFVVEAKAARLLCGLAGSLRLEDVPLLRALGPDYLGFRGALCVDQARTNRLSADRLRRIRAAIAGPGGSGLAAAATVCRDQPHEPGKPLDALPELP